MNRFAVSCCVVVLSGVIGGPAHAGPSPAFMLTHLEQSSAVIVVARVREVRQESAPPVMVQRVKSTPFIATCQTLAVWNGTVDGRTTEMAVHFLRDEPFRDFERLRKGELAVLFLKRNETGALTLARERRSKIPLASYSGALDKPDADVKTRLAAQLMGQLDAKEPRDVESALYWANEIEYAIPEQRLVRLSQSSDVGVRFAALSQLVRRGNRPAVAEAVEIVLSADVVEQQQSQRTVKTVGFDGIHVVERQYLGMIHRIAWDLARCMMSAPVPLREANAMIIEDPMVKRWGLASVSVQQANAMAGSKDAWVSRWGIEILKVAGDASSVPVLIRGLELPDREAQYCALQALGRILDRRGPSFDQFSADRDGEIARFKSWWAKERKSSTKDQ